MCFGVCVRPFVRDTMVAALTRATAGQDAQVRVLGGVFMRVCVGVCVGGGWVMCVCMLMAARVCARGMGGGGTSWPARRAPARRFILAAIPPINTRTLPD